MSSFVADRSSAMSSFVATPWKTATRIVSVTASAWEVPMPAFSRLRTAARVSNVATLIGSFIVPKGPTGQPDRSRPCRQ